MHKNLLLLISLLVGLGGCQVHFNCPQLPPLSKPAENVYELRPQDIKVVMALGDSITAGTYLDRYARLLISYSINTQFISVLKCVLSSVASLHNRFWDEWQSWKSD